MAEKKWLIYTSVGEGAAVSRWLTECLKADVAVCRYHSAAPSFDFAKYRLTESGLKIANFFKLVKRFPEMSDHDYFLFADDDIVIGKESVERFMREVEKGNLDLAQPALTRESESQWKHLFQRRDHGWERTLFVEVQFFAISKALLMKSLPLMESCSFGYGVDLIFSNYLRQGRFRAGIVHSVSMHHPPRNTVTSIRQRPEYESERKKIDAVIARAFPGGIDLSAVYAASQRWKRVNRFTLFLAQWVARYPSLGRIARKVTMR